MKSCPPWPEVRSSASEGDHRQASWAIRPASDRSTVATRPGLSQASAKGSVKVLSRERGRARARSRSRGPCLLPANRGLAPERRARPPPCRAPGRRRRRPRRRPRPGSSAARSRSGPSVPRRSMIGVIPAAPIATSVVPWRNGRPKESVTTTPTVLPVSSAKRARRRLALASGSTGSSTSVPGSGAFEWSTPAEAQINPCRVWAITSGPRSRMICTASWRITSTSRGSRSSPASSRAFSDGTIPSMRTTDPRPSRPPSGRRRRCRRPRSSASSAIIDARSSPSRTSGRPCTGMIWITPGRGRRSPGGRHAPCSAGSG